MACIPIHVYRNNINNILLDFIIIEDNIFTSLNNISYRYTRDSQNVGNNFVLTVKIFIFFFRITLFIF